MDTFEELRLVMINLMTVSDVFLVVLNQQIGLIVQLHLAMELQIAYLTFAMGIKHRQKLVTMEFLEHQIHAQIASLMVLALIRVGLVWEVTSILLIIVSLNAGMV